LKKTLVEQKPKVAAAATVVVAVAVAVVVIARLPYLHESEVGHLQLHRKDQISTPTSYTVHTIQVDTGIHR